MISFSTVLQAVLPIYLLAELGLNWFFFMLGLSLLTTLYGYFVEERSLA